MKRKPYYVFVSALIICVLAATIAYSQIKVVNITPDSRSNEVNTDNEPNIAVNPANPNVLVISAFTPSRANSGDPASAFCGIPNTAPVFVSTDGGNTWILSCIVPSDAMGTGTGDITLKFGATSNVLYGGILRRPGSLLLNILRTNDLTTPMTVLVIRSGVDQPYIQATSVLEGIDVGKDRVYIGNNNNLFAGPRTATVDLSLDAATAPPTAGFNPSLIETRDAAVTPFGRQDGPSIRPAIHSNGTIYAAFFGWRIFGSPTNTTDVVVVRDNNWGMGLTPFRDLINTDTLAGVRVVTGVAVPSLGTLLGNQRIGSQLSVAVDPTNSQTVYIAWADGTNANNYTVHVRRSTLGGAAGTWSGDLRTITRATNPALAINSQGKVGLLYQSLVNPGSGNRWQTHLERSGDGFATPPTDDVLANVPDDLFGNGAGPLGDYIDLTAVGRDFYGVFSAKNTPDMANFPSGVTYLRQADFASRQLFADAAHTTTVPPSIDTFFFKAIEPAADLAIMKSDAPDPVITGSNITYTITVKNNGPTDASSVTVADNLPAVITFNSCSVSGAVAGSCSAGSSNNRTITFPSFPANATATITLTAQVNCSVVDGLNISNTATVSSTTPDPDPSNNTATTTTMASNPAPVITCPKDQIAVTPKPGDVSTMVTYPAPTVMDNCPGATVVCSPPSGSVFPLGMSTVNCTATDSAGAKASCSFKVTVFDVCIQDDGSGDFLQFNSFTGDYMFKHCGPDEFTMVGKGKITRVGCSIKLEDDTRVVIGEAIRCPSTFTGNTGNARIKRTPLGPTFVLQDTYILNNSCGCP